MLEDHGQRQTMNLIMYLPCIAQLVLPDVLPLPVPSRSLVAFAYRPPGSPYRRPHRLKLFHSLLDDTDDQRMEQVLGEVLKCLNRP